MQPFRALLDDPRIGDVSFILEVPQLRWQGALAANLRSCASLADYAIR